MNVTTVHGSICMDNPSHNHGCRDYPLPVPLRYCITWIFDHERESQYTVFLARESRPVNYCDRPHPWFFIYGVAFRMVKQ
jgi:hypothetical protein